jgi:hypothetical protein
MHDLKASLAGYTGVRCHAVVFQAPCHAQVDAIAQLLFQAARQCDRRSPPKLHVLALQASR